MKYILDNFDEIIIAILACTVCAIPLMIIIHFAFVGKKEETEYPSFQKFNQICQSVGGKTASNGKEWVCLK